MASNSQFAIAVHTMALLARSGDEFAKSDCIARSVNTNPVVIRRVLCALSDAGLVTSHTGPNGGSRLVLSPATISLLDINRAIEQRAIFGLHCRPPDQDCPVGRNIESVLCDVQQQVEGAINSVLASITLDAIVQQLEPELINCG
jgi:Rrf2 family protein